LADNRHWPALDVPYNFIFLSLQPSVQGIDTAVKPDSVVVSCQCFQSDHCGLLRNLDGLASTAGNLVNHFEPFVCKNKKSGMVAGFFMIVSV